MKKRGFNDLKNVWQAVIILGGCAIAVALFMFGSGLVVALFG